VILASRRVAGEAPSMDILEKNFRVAVLGVATDAVVSDSTLHISSCKELEARCRIHFSLKDYDVATLKSRDTVEPIFTPSLTFSG
jgi:hypothetical protein